MTDILDRASEEEERQRELAVRRAQERFARPQDWESASATWCGTCGQRISDERRRAVPGVKFCVDCQARQELIEKNGW